MKFLISSFFCAMMGIGIGASVFTHYGMEPNVGFRLENTIKTIEKVSADLFHDNFGKGVFCRCFPSFLYCSDSDASSQDTRLT